MSVVFYLIAAITLAGGLATVLLKHLVHSALAATVAFGGLALLFLSLDAQFAGFAQILVYIGAVAILIVFAILLTRGSELPKRRSLQPDLARRVGACRGRLRLPRLGRSRKRARLAEPGGRSRCHGARHRQRARGPLRAPARNRRAAAYCSHHRRGHRSHARERRCTMTPLAWLSHGRGLAVRHRPRWRAYAP